MGGYSGPRYVEIAGELRGRIEAGSFATGDRIPSTREITRQWGVAMATATKVLAVLQDEGLVRSVPGVGTIVNDSPGKPPKTTRTRRHSSPSTTPETLVQAALAVVDLEGLAGLSMRRVAADLGVSTMSLYRHVADKDDLLLRMMDAALKEQSLPTPAPESWRERLEVAAHTLWATFRRHPWLAQALSLTRPQAIDGGLEYAEWVLSALADTGLSPAQMLTTHLTLVNHVRGTAINLELEIEAEATSGMDRDEWMELQDNSAEAIIATGKVPTFNLMDVPDFDVDLDALLEFGLQRLLDGVAVLIDSP